MAGGVLPSTSLVQCVETLHLVPDGPPLSVAFKCINTFSTRELEILGCIRRKIDNAFPSLYRSRSLIGLSTKMSTQQTLTLFPLSSYTFTTKAAQPEEDPSVAARLQRLQNQYEDLGMRHTVEAVLVVHDHGHPHVLMIQIANAFFKLPGDYLRPAEEETCGLARRLDERLAPEEDDPNSYGPGGMSAGSGGDWEVGDCLAQWWRPAFETFMYPYVPAHITKPKECKKLFLVQMPPTKVLAVPKNMKLLAVPLFELYDNSQRYGPQLSAIPHLLSRYNFIYSD